MRRVIFSDLTNTKFESFQIFTIVSVLCVYLIGRIKPLGPLNIPAFMSHMMMMECIFHECMGVRRLITYYVHELQNICECTVIINLAHTDVKSYVL